MARLSLLLLSTLFLAGCFCTNEITVIPQSKIFVPTYHDYNVTVRAVKKDGKITMSVSDFNKRTKQILSAKEHAKAVDQIVEKFNNYDYNKGNSNE